MFVKKLARRLLVACLFTANLVSYAQVNDRRFNNFSVNNGLSQSTVFAITQDTLGFIWVGTQDGLNRYDGRNFIVYRPKKNDNRAISSFYIRTLFRDAQGSVWVGGNGGIDVYNYLSNSFENYGISPGTGEWYISGILQDREGKIWACSNSGELYVSDKQRKKFTTVLTSKTSGIGEVYGLVLWNNHLLLGTGSGLWTFDMQTRTITKWHAGLPTVRINCLYEDKGSLWIGTEGEGLLQWQASTQTFKKYISSGAAGSIANNNVRSVKKDKDGSLWVGTFSGLSIMNQEGYFQNYFHDPKNQFTIGQNSVRFIFRDRQDGMWLGTFYGGMSYYHDRLISFNTLVQSSVMPSLNDDVVNVIKQDKSGNFWIGTESGGVNYWDPLTRQIRYYTSNRAGGGLSSNTIKSIEFDSNGNVFLGTHNTGLNILNPATGAVKNYRHLPGDTSGLSGNMVYALLRDHMGRMWVGTRNGLDIYNPGTDRFTHFYRDNTGRSISATEITYLMQDSRKRIWIGTINGVSVLDTENGMLKNISNSSLSYNVINVITEDHQKRIWVGTRDGLNLYDERTQTFTNYNNRPDLLRGNINSVVADPIGNLWITTNNSLVKYTPDTRSIIYYDQRDGLQNNQFNVYAGLSARDGMLLFGGVGGLSYFYPGSLNQRPLPMKITFTGLEVFDHLVIPGDSTGILEQHLNEARELVFSSDYKQFTLFFNTFNYISDNHTNYIYKLEGFDKDWQKVEGIPKATYTNLQPGTYQFSVKAADAYGKSSDTRILKLIIKPVWYKSNWFYALVTLFILIMVVFLYRVLTERMRAVHQLRLERINREKANYLNKVKMDFFTNVSHELRTPLTLIMAPLEEILNEPETDKKQRRRHELMMRNTKRLYTIVNQLFEFRKTESGTRVLRVAKANLGAVIQDTYKSFLPLAEKKKINYDFETTINDLLVFFDKEAIENISFNLLSNAFKYTQEGQTITVMLDASATHVVLTVNDTGKGIAKEHIPKIFDRFYQVEGGETNLGSGVGLAFTRRLVELHHGFIEVKSQPGEGSSFVVYLPLADEAYKDDARVDAVKDNEWPELEVNSEILSAAVDIEDNIELPDKNAEKETVLIVDDNAEIVSYLEEFFSTNYKVVTANDGRQALGVIDKIHPDAIISDVMMPEMDGLHFCKKIKQNIQTSHIPVILLTAKSETYQQLRGLEMGADDYVTKPFSIAVLEARLQNILRTRKRLREYYAAGKEIEPEKLTFNDLDEEFLKKAINIIENNLDEYNFSVEKLSQDLGMSRSNLYLKIKAITGESVTFLIKRIRLKKAADLILQKKYTVSEIAYMCGFNTPSYFSTAFKQFYGCMPTEYLDRKATDKD